MSRFNKVSQGQKTINKAGGNAYIQSPALELVSILLTSFANNQYYESANNKFDRLKELLKVVTPEFSAKAAIYARTEFGMRSISHVLASELGKYITGKEWAKNFYDSIVYRPDDMTEILSYHNLNNKAIPNAMKKGFAKAFDKFDGYQLAKYKGQNKLFKLVDIVNLVHPKPTEKNKQALEQLINGSLKSFDTWESKLTNVGQKAETEEQKKELKKDAWVTLIKEKKIGYFALLRNLRNILEQAPEVLNEALEMLTDEKIIKKSLVLPFRFLTAIKEIQKINNTGVRNVLIALSNAAEISLNNVPRFDGKTLIVLDVSGSMTWKESKGFIPGEIGALFGMALYKTNDADFMTFDNFAKYYSFNPMDSLGTLMQCIKFTGGGTNFHSIFQTANKLYDRIIILSDMQGWIGYNSPVNAFNEYKKRTGANPFIYSFDLQNYGSMQFPEQNVFCLSGFSDKVFDIMKLLEQDKKALINEINKIQLK